MRLGSRVSAGSRWLHKYVGLVLSLYFVWMAASGILLNHTDMIEGISCPLTIMGEEHLYRNWSRGACRGAAFSESEVGVAYLYGKEGVWLTDDDGRSFRPLNEGLPRASAQRDVRTMLACARGVLLAGGSSGLWVARRGEAWRRVRLEPDLGGIVKLLAVNERVVALTDSGAFAARIDGLAQAPVFAPLALARPPDPGDEQIGGVEFVLGVHSGEVLGLPGKLLMDMAGLALVFLAVSGFAMWHAPWRGWLNRRFGVRRPRARPALLRFLNRYHRSVGVWAAALAATSVITGLLLCIPLVMMLSGKSVSATFAPGLRSDNPWHGHIQNALYDDRRETIVIAADGYWEAPADLSEPFALIDGAPGGGVMGLSVFEPTDDGYLVGSFGGLLRWARETGEVVDHLTGEAPKRGRGPVGAFMTSAWFQDLRGREWGVDFRKGLRCLTEDSDAYAMPREVVENGRIPLWLVLHYLHNGRIWSMVSTSGRLLFGLLAALLAIVVLLTGGYDWLHEQRRRKAARREIGVDNKQPVQGSEPR